MLLKLRLGRIWKLKMIILFRQNPYRSNINKSKKRGSKFIITSSNSTKSFYFIEKTFYQMTFFVKVIIAIPWLFCIRFRWNGIVRSLRIDIIKNIICSVSTISKNVTVTNVKCWEQRYSLFWIVNFASCKNKINRISKSINNSMNFGGFTTSTYADKLVIFWIYSPFLAPALCGCAFMEVLSILRFSKSASTFNASKICNKVPSSRHLQKRL